MLEIWIIYTIDRVINRSFSGWNLWIYYFRLMLRLSKIRLHLFNSAVIANSKMDYSHLELEIFSELSGIRILLLSNSRVCTNIVVELVLLTPRNGSGHKAVNGGSLFFFWNLHRSWPLVGCRSDFTDCAWRWVALRFPSNLTSTGCTRLFTVCESQLIPSCKCRELQTVQCCQQETILTVLLDT